MGSDARQVSDEVMATATRFWMLCGKATELDPSGYFVASVECTLNAFAATAVKQARERIVEWLDAQAQEHRVSAQRRLREDEGMAAHFSDIRADELSRVAAVIRDSKP